MASSCLPFHHCLDIWASISSIFFSVVARSSRLEIELVWKKEGRPASSGLNTGPLRRILRKWSNSRRRTKSFCRLRSIISLSAAFPYSFSCSVSGSGLSKSDQSLVGLRTNRAILDSKPELVSLVSMAGTNRNRGHKRRPSIPKHLLLEFPALLSLQRQIGGRARQQTPDPDGFTGFITIAIVARVDARERLFNFLQQLALTVPGAQLQGVFFFNGGPIGRIRHHHRVGPQMLSGLAGVAQNVLFERGQHTTKKRQLSIVHVLFIGHGDQFGLGQLLNRFEFPVVDQCRVLFDGGSDRRNNVGRDYGL